MTKHGPLSKAARTICRDWASGEEGNARTIDAIRRLLATDPRPGPTTQNVALAIWSETATWSEDRRVRFRGLVEHADHRLAEFVTALVST